jgi:hypothetical protein
MSTIESNESQEMSSQPIVGSQVVKTLTKDEIIQNLKHGIDELNSKFDSSEWGQVEVRVSEFENDVLKCLVSGIDSVPTEYPVIGEQLYLSIRDNFKKPIKLILEKSKKSKSEDKSSSDEEGDKKKKKEKKVPVMKKIDQMRQENTIKSLSKTVETLIETFTDTRMNCNYGLNTNKIVELRGITFAYMAWYILETKNAKDFLEKKSKRSEVYEVMCSMQRFINTCKAYNGKSVSNSQNTVAVSTTLIADVEKWLDRLKSVYPFDGITIYNTAPKLLIHSQYDDCIPGRTIKMRPNQRQLMEAISSHPEGFLMFYNAAIASGKTTLASVGIASHLERLKKSGRMGANMQLIFCCNLASVRRQVARNCWNAGIKFGIGSYVKSTGTYKITNHWSTNDENRIVVIASPEVTTLLLEEDEKKILEDAAKPFEERRFYSGKYWLFLDEPTVGADIIGSKYLESNTKVMCHMPKWTVLSSATMPVPEKIPDIISHHKDKYPEVYVETQITKEISIGCDVETFEYDMVVPHIGCKTKEQLKTCITKINEVPFLGRLYTHRVAEKLWKTMTENGITDITNISEYFSNVDNLSADKVRLVCIGMLEKLSEQTNPKIKKVCSSNITAEKYAVKEKKKVDDDDDGFCFEGDDEDTTNKVLDHVEFSKFGTSEAAKYLNMNLITSLDPISTAKESFSELMEDVKKSGIDTSRLRNFISTFEKKKEEYQRSREYLAKSLGVDSGGNEFEQQRKLQHFEDEAKKRGCGTDDCPTIDFPKEFQINTLSHWKKYCSHYSVNAGNLRAQINIGTLPLSEFEADDWLVFLLFCGVGVYSPYQIKDQVYLREVLNLAEGGKLAFLISDSSICYGTNYPINRVFITKDFAETHSINTIFQLMGRAGRAGQSWKAEIFVDSSTALKIVEFVQNTDNRSGELEAENINITFTELSKEARELQEKIRIKAEEDEKRLIEEALAEKKRIEEGIRLKLLQKELAAKEGVKPKKIVSVQEVTHPTEKKVYDKPYHKKDTKEDSWTKIGEWRKRSDNNNYGDREKRSYNNNYGDREKRSDGYQPRHSQQYSQPWRNLTSTPAAESTSTKAAEETTKYVPPWKRNAGETKEETEPESHPTYKKTFVKKSEEKKEAPKSDSKSWRK